MTSSLPVVIPDQLKGRGLRFTRLRPPILGDKNSGKGPVDPGFYDDGALAEDDTSLLSYIKAGGGFGLVGTYGDFIGFDADEGEELEALGIMARLPRTLTDRAPHKPESLHLYYICPGLPKTFHFYHPTKTVEKAEKGEEGGEVKQLVRLELGQICAGRGHITGPGAPHWSGGRREIIDDSPLAEITVDDLRAILRGLAFSDDPTKNPTFETAAGLEEKAGRWDALEEITRKARRGRRGDGPSLSERIGDIRRVLDTYGWSPTTKSGDNWKGDIPGEVSKSKTALAVDIKKGVWYCHHHADSGGDAAALVALFEGLIDCRGKDHLKDPTVFQAVIKACEEKGLVDPEGEGEDDRGPGAKAPATSTEKDDGVKCITEEELIGLPVAENPRLSINLEPDNFISEYVDYASSLSDAYVEYHYAGGLFMASTAIDRRVVLKLKQGTVHSNLWLFCLGNSTTSRKTTAMNGPGAILDTYEVGRRLPSSFSPEALIEALADCPRSFFMKDEAGSLLAAMGKKYMDEARDFFSELYEGKDYHRKLRTGQRKEKRDFPIKSPYVTQWLATTPDNFRAYTSELDVTSGWLLRYGFFWPDHVKPWKAFEEATEEDFSRYTTISIKYRDLKEKLAGLDIEGLKLSLTAEGWEHFSGWQQAIEERAMREEDRILQAVAGRLMTFALKLAMVFTVGRSDFDPSTTRAVSLEHVQEATRQVETYFLPTARVVIEEVARSERENLQNQIIGTIRRAGGKIARRDLLRKLHVKLDDVDKAISALEASEEIETLKVEGKGPTRYVYRLTVTNVPIVPSVPSVSSVTQIQGNSTRSVKSDRDKSSAFGETDGTVGTVGTVATEETGHGHVRLIEIKRHTASEEDSTASGGRVPPPPGSPAGDGDGVHGVHGGDGSLISTLDEEIEKGERGEREGEKKKGGEREGKVTKSPPPSPPQPQDDGFGGVHGVHGGDTEAVAGEIPDPDDYQSIAEKDDKLRQVDGETEEGRAPTIEEAEVLADVAGRILQNWPGLPEMLLWETTRDRLGRPISIATVRLWLSAEGYILSSERLNGSPLWNPPVGVIS